MSKPVLYLMVGYPGSGKTTVAGLIHDITGAQHIWADQERIKRFDKPLHERRQSRILYNQLNDEARGLLKRGQSVIYDTNFSFKSDRQRMQTLAAEAGAECKLIWVQTPRQLAKTRAVEDSENKPTRLWGNMPEADFERLANNLEEPTTDENPITIAGVDVDEAMIRAALA